MLINNSFLNIKKLIKTRLLTALSAIHLSADMWTSPNKKAFLAVVAHFVDKEGVLRKALLALPQLRGSHGGELQAMHINRVIDDYGLALLEPFM